jgi:ABC-type multidrug transport system ATPase subunit
MDLIDEFTLAEQIRFHFKMKPVRNRLTIDEMLQRMYLSDSRDKFIANFSSGMRQRVKLALAFFTQANIIFLDEPCTNLDQDALNWYRNELAKVPKECILFIASNQPSEYPDSAQNIGILSYK